MWFDLARVLQYGHLVGLLKPMQRYPVINMQHPHHAGADLLNVYENWQYGPLLEVHILFDGLQLSDLSLPTAWNFLTQLGISRVGLSPRDVMAAKYYEGDWRTEIPLEGVWKLEDEIEVGVRILPEFPADHPNGDLSLSIPPRFIQAYFGDILWFRHVEPGTLRLHADLLNRLQRAHGVVPIRTAAVWVEAETWQNVETLTPGIHIAPLIFDAIDPSMFPQFPWPVYGYCL